MLWSVIKILLFISTVAALTLGAGYLMESGGVVRIALDNVEFTLGPLQAAIGAVLLLLGLWLVLKLTGLLIAVLKFLNGNETALSRYFDRNRQNRGFEALADGMLALASGDGRLAMSKAAKAEKFLQRPDLTNLLVAQAAELGGDDEKAGEAYKRLLGDDRTRFVGVRGLLKQKLAEGDTETALQLAKKAFALKPRQTEIQDMLLGLQAEQEDWLGARQTLSAKLKTGSLPRDVYRRRDAVLALSQAREVLAEGNTIEAHEDAILANRLSPDLIPAAVMAARSYITDDKPRYATRVLKKAWGVNPHPDLAAAFAKIAPDETPAQRLKRFQTLTRVNPTNAETRMLVAELEIATGDFPAARKAIGDLTEDQPTARVLTIMAAIERGEGSDDAAVRAWLTKALNAPRGPQWVCDHCQTVHAHWAPVCNTCSSFDTLSWRPPAQDEVAMPASTEMLPLIIGRPDSKAPEAAESRDTAAAEPTQPSAEKSAPQTPENTAGEATPTDAIDGEVVALGGKAANI